MMLEKFFLIIIIRVLIQCIYFIYRNLSQWPLPLEELTSLSTTLTARFTLSQLKDLEKKILPVQQMIISLRPKERFSLLKYIPDFEYDNDVDINDNYIQLLSSSEVNDNNDQLLISSEIDENVNHESFSDALYNEIDGKTRSMYSSRD